MTRLEDHPIAACYPLLGQVQLEELADDIKAHGQRLPILLWEGKVLDGRNRARACELAGLEPRTELATCKDDDEASALVVSLNERRRDLTPSQKAMAAAELSRLLEQRARERQRAGKPGPNRGSRAGRSARQAAERLDVSHGYVSEARALVEKAPELATRVKDGTVTLQEAKKLARLPEPARAAAVEMLDAGQVKDAKGALAAVKLEAKQALAAELRAQPLPPPTGPFGVLVVDPPWPYEVRTEDASHRGNTDYPTMSLAEILALPVHTLAAEDAILWLWVTNAFMRRAFDCIDAWGFQEKTILTWTKGLPGVGNWLRNSTEHCVLAVRGKPLVQLKAQTTELRAPRREHSRKPEGFFELVESLCPDARRLEMFSREQRAGWASWGAETGKLAPPAQMTLKGGGA